MPRLLPAVADRADFSRARQLPVDDWRPALQALAARHGLPDEPLERFSSGCTPVFGVGLRYVVKFVPRHMAPVVQREAECLRYFADQTNLPVARLVAEGTLEDWYYVVSSRLPGEQFDRVWPRLNPPEQMRLAGDFGRLLRALHQIPVGALRPGGIVWAQFYDSAVASWTTRRDLDRLPETLRVDGPRFLAAAEAARTDGPVVLLHGDLAPENALVEHDATGWRFSGLLDFGNAMAGDPLFDLTAPTVLLAPGQAEVVDRMLAGYGGLDSPRAGVLRTRLMALTLIHPMADLPGCLALVNGAAECSTWEAVAEIFWPGFDCG
jgi:hygromycin-B 7''-O-kinase